MTANQNIIDLIARRYSSPSETLAETKANSQRKSSGSDVALKIPEKVDEPQQQNSQSPQTPTSPSTMLNKLSPGNIFKNIFK
jgi:hypothetical protein